MSTKKLQIIGGLGNKIELDVSLTQEGKAASAKAVGDALASKADQSTVDVLSGLVGDISVSEQITTAISESGFVSYEIAQSITEEQKEQARTNIGFSENDALALVVDLNLVSPVAAADGSIYTDENGVLYTL